MRAGQVALGLAVAVVPAGCGTTRSTDTPRTATEMMLVSQAVDTAVGRLDFTALAGRPVFLDPQYLDGTVDKGYLVSSLRQHLLAHGALVQEERAKATYVVEVRAGGVGTDRHSLLVGVPQMTLPNVVPGVPVPASIPEIALLKRTDQKGVAKIAVFAYNRTTGRALWQSGLVEANSNLEDTWVAGAGPFSRGTIRRRTELAGEPLPTLAPAANPADAAPAVVSVGHQQTWADSDQPPPTPPRPPDPTPPAAPAPPPAGPVQPPRGPLSILTGRK